MTRDQFMAASLSERAAWWGETPDSDPDKRALCETAQRANATPDATPADRDLSFLLQDAAAEWRRVAAARREDERNGAAT